MKIKKYINKKSYKNIDFYNIKLINKEIYNISKREFFKILSIIATVNINNWWKKRYTIAIEYEVVFKILYSDSSNSKVFFVKDIVFYYDEIPIKYQKKYIDFDILLKRNMVKVGSNVQDIQIININGDYIKLLATILNWIEIEETPNVLIYRNDNFRGSYLYITNDEINNVDHLISLENDILTNIIFSKEGEMIFYIRNRNNKKFEIEGFNLLDRTKKKLLESYNIKRLDIISKSEIIYVEKSEFALNVKVLNIRNLSTAVIMANIQVEIKEVYCSNGYIYMLINENSIYKVIVLNRSGKVLKSISGEYRNIILIDNDRKFLAIKNNEIYLINISSLESEKLNFDDLKLKQIKLLNNNEFVVYGNLNNVANLILVNIETFEKKVLLELEEEIYEWFIVSNDEILLSFKIDNRVVLKKFIIEKGIKNIGEIEGNIVNMIVRGG